MLVDSNIPKLSEPVKTMSKVKPKEKWASVWQKVLDEDQAKLEEKWDKVFAGYQDQMHKSKITIAVAEFGDIENKQASEFRMWLKRHNLYFYFGTDKSGERCVVLSPFNL